MNVFQMENALYHYISLVDWMNLHTFNKHCIKPGSKFLFRFVDILESKFFTKVSFDMSVPPA